MTRQDHIIQVTRKARAICSCQCFCRRNVTEDPVRLVGGIDLCLMFNVYVYRPTPGGS